MLIDKILAVVLASLLSFRACRADTNTSGPTVQFFELPYHQEHDSQNQARVVQTVTAKEGCQLVQMDEGIRSVQPGWGTVCDIFA